MSVSGVYVFVTERRCTAADRRLCHICSIVLRANLPFVAQTKEPLNAVGVRYCIQRRILQVSDLLMRILGTEV